MKNLCLIAFFATFLLFLNSCVSISNTADDDVYMVKSSQIPAVESLDDETNYSAFRYKKDRNNNNTRYVSGGGLNNFDPFIGVGMGFRSNSFVLNPYQMFASPYFNDRSWAYIPGYGWSYVNPYMGYPFYNGFGNYYNNGYFGGFQNNYYGWNNNGWGNNGWNNNGWGNNGWNNNAWDNNNGWNNNNNGGSNGGGGSSNPYHHSGPRGSSGGGGVITRSNIPGTLKNSNSPLANSQTGSGTIVKPVERETIISRNNPSRQTEVITRSNNSSDFSRPGRIQGGISNNSRGSSSVGSSSRGNSGFTGINNGSESSSSPRNSGGISSPSNRISGSGSIGTSSGSEGRGGNSSGGGSTTRPSSGSSSGGRR